MKVHFRKFRDFFYSRLLSYILKKNCPVSISRSGDAGRKVNCYTVELRNAGAPRLLINLASERGVEGLAWSGREYITHEALSFNELRSFSLVITHYYGLYEIRFNGVIDYILGKVLCRPYLTIFFIKIKQLIFNQINPFRYQKVKVLERIVDLHIEKGGDAFTSWEIMTDLYTNKWFDHPLGEKAHRKIRLFLDSLVDTGDLEKGQHVNEYKLKGKALETLSIFGLEERRHQENLSIQRRITMLTLVMAITALVTLFNKQLIRLLVDLTNFCFKLS